MKCKDCQACDNGKCKIGKYQKLMKNGERGCSTREDNIKRGLSMKKRLIDF